MLLSRGSNCLKRMLMVIVSWKLIEINAVRQQTIIRMSGWLHNSFHILTGLECGCNWINQPYSWTGSIFMFQVYLFVSSHVFQPGKPFVADITFMRFQTSVGEEVALEILCRSITITTFITHKGLLPSMCSFMHHKLILSIIWLLTELASRK